VVLWLAFAGAAYGMEVHAGLPESLPGAEIANGNLTLLGATGTVLPCIAKAFGTPHRWV
jgi:hypothetical protein